ncbi:LysR family transcriptional regulator [Mesorhizobium loti R88b]|uniref:LysR family transcriptional regulator n=1 Tax=Mesorhizobium loti R88b TaxID=935548 RepID=A0A6M7X278_RHILI|nr:LysR family transcriptional regulator [Mesorhizobium loti]QKD06218.1 LysR family transcriptional regulator [Mesorhizobium loti R88b]
MNLRRLEYFMAVAEELHFGRAAERLSMAQPPLSRQIIQLEAELEVALFDRGRGQTVLTQAGEALQKRAREMLAAMDDAVLEVRRIDQGAKGRLRVAFVGSATHGILPGLIQAFRASYPDVNLSLWSMNNAQQYLALIRKDVDIAIARPKIDDPEIVSIPIQEEPLSLASAESNNFTAGEPVLLTDLKELPFVLYPEQPRPSFADQVLSLCRGAGFEPRSRVFCMDYQTAISLVSVGEGVSIVPQSVGLTGHKGVQFSPIASPDAKTGLSVNYRRDNREKHLVRFAEIARKLARSSS